MGIYGYIRVYSSDKNEDRQLLAMKQLGICQIFVDKQSEKDFDRISYKAMVGKLEAGDLVYIKSIDRLGRNYEDVLDQWRILTKELGVDVAVIDMPLFRH